MCGESYFRPNFAVLLISALLYVVGFLWVVNNIFADSIMIYRDYIFWQKNVWITALPILALLGTTVSGFYEDYLLLELALFPQSPNQLAPPSKFVALSNLESTVDGASTVLVMVTNILTTLLIVSRIWWMTRGMRETLGLRTAKRYHQIMAMMVESGAIYAISLLICAIFKFDLGLSGLGGPIYAVATQLQTIAPTLIIIRVRIKECVEDTTLGQSNPVAAPPTFSPIPARRSDRQESMLGGGMQEIVVVEGGSLELTTMGGDAHEVSIESLRRDSVDFASAISNRAPEIKRDGAVVPSV
ncbi:hypothetical protein JAAARDRAFT_76761 [Jaapia argillacea MUCL 33604]|uniref:Uncharacterized protein n=1 Tax=Jaapia argillacea MUCL 33604 TaxID=933084 RepID=A0A067Q464_9AGAM|nr:hypothetical protein JAAARDRAFT_76761 [Jaapia argillacea MUCL 33604]